MSNRLLKLLNVILLLAIIAVIPLGIKAYSPIEKNNKAVEALHNKEYDRAITLLSEAIQDSPNNQTFKRNLLAAYNSKAIDLEREGKDKDSLDWYERALAIDPENQTILRNYISTLNNLAVAGSNARNFTDSQQLFERASSRLNKLADANIQNDVRHNYSALLTVWGAELMKRDEVEASRKTFEQSLMLNPSNAVANIYLGDLYYDANNYANALKYYRAAKPPEPENAEYLKNRIQMIEDESKVEALFKQAIDPLGHFNIQFVEYRDGISVSDIFTILNDARKSVGAKLGIYPARAVNVKIYTAKDFYQISRLPEWAISIFDGKMRLKTDDLQGAATQVRDLLFHEYTHAVLAMNIKQRVPAWFHEGLAQLMEPQFSENSREQQQMRDALAKSKLDFASLQDSFKELGSKDVAETAYLLSKYFLASLNRQYGKEKLAEWVKHLTAEEKFEEAFQKVYGVDLKKAQEDWTKAQAKR
jgi:tetratricopeptide (TPR) repeat protein